MRISACMIAKNEEKCIARCIESYKEVVDEIIVVDTGSTDRTVDIAKGLGAQVFYYKWDNDFARAKNFALDKAKGDWVIFLDADEYFVEQTALLIPRLLKTIHSNNKIQGVYCKLYNINEDKKNEIMGSGYYLRIFRHNKKNKFVGDIHEQVMCEGKPLQTVSTPENTIKIYHTGYSANLMNHKLRRNLEPLLKKVDEGYSDALTHFYLSDCYLGLKEFELAVKHGRLAIDKGMQTYSHDVKPYLNIINSLMNLKYPYDEIIKEINRAIDRFPLHPDFYRLLGNLNYTHGRLQQAEEAYKQSLELFNKYDEKEYYSEKKYITDIYFQLGLISSCKNDDVTAFEYFLKVLTEKKKDILAFDQLIRLMMKEQPEEIIYFLKSMYDENNLEDIDFLVTCLMKHRMGIVFMYFQNIWLKKFGKQDVSVMFVLLCAGKYEEAFKHFAEAALLENGEWAAIYAVAAAILSGNIDNFNKISAHSKTPLRKIGEAYFGLAGEVTLSVEEMNDYVNLLREFILLGAEPQIKRLIALKDLFDRDIENLIGEVFLKTRDYNRAIEHFGDALNKERDNSEIYFKLGYCYYKNYSYVNAVEMFRKALEHGYQKYDIYDYLYWISQQCTDENTRNEAATAALMKETGNR